MAGKFFNRLHIMNYVSLKNEGLLFLFCLYSTTSFASLDIVVKGGVSGLLGYTNFISGNLGPGPLNSDVYNEMDSPNILSTTTACPALTSMFKGTGGSPAYGFPIVPVGSTYTVATAVPDGFSTWTRKMSNSPDIVTGMTTWTNGSWHMSWTPDIDIAGHSGGNSSSPEGEGPAGKGACPNPGSGTKVAGVFDATFLRSSTFKFRFAIYPSTSAGLSPGKYRFVKPLNLTDRAGTSSGDLKQSGFLDDINIVVANYSCSINLTNNNIKFDSLKKAETINATVICGDEPSNLSSESMSVLLAAEAAGAAKAETEAGPDGEWRELVVPNSNGKLTIVGNWGSTIPTCTSSDMHFDGRDGPVLGTINPGDVGRQFTQALSFAYCNDNAPPGIYQTQATIRVVTR
ncbi:hypothetical protein [Escherichia coli]|uniref:hypothetical protein n=1 Tax=Escherichia coli TaxID=562 RepID=UPI0019D207C2|nr:hypothetical protein [Escherichia coli]MBN6133684.1 hypothetical protein [Escherichia coli]MBN6453992.1 hypothetical protein [Escherichia coli]